MCYNSEIVLTVTLGYIFVNQVFCKYSCDYTQSHFNTEFVPRQI